jgi:hypothetical protein
MWGSSILLIASGLMILSGIALMLDAGRRFARSLQGGSVRTKLSQVSPRTRFNLSQVDSSRR